MESKCGSTGPGKRSKMPSEPLDDNGLSSTDRRVLRWIAGDADEDGVARLPGGIRAKAAAEGMPYRTAYYSLDKLKRKGLIKTMPSAFRARITRAGIEVCGG